jgi:hypothetical protein
MKKIVWAPTVIWDRYSFLYFDQVDQKLKGMIEMISDIHYILLKEKKQMLFY